MPDLDHGPLADDFDRYEAAFGPLPFHFQKLPVQVMSRLAALAAEAVQRGSPITKAELIETGYQHPVDGLYY